MTDAEGRFTLRVPTTGARLFIRAEGLAPWDGGFMADQKGVTIRLLAPSVVEGVVRAGGAGEPVAGVTV